ncbi:hypothetical protein BZA77DRAFT_239428 [Pyronema omphalodes]|nr:hypothetical protein BZA77DRAFT_239428 [Pyronema omphalodes]
MTVPSEDHPVPETSKDKPTSSNTLSDYELKPPSYDESTGDPSNPSKSDNPSNSGNPIDPTKLSESFASDPLFKNKFPFDLPYCEELFLDNSKFKDWITNSVKPVKTYEPNNKESVEDYPIYFQKKCFDSALYQCYDKLNKGYNGKDLEDVLNKAWDVDRHMTLKIIWNTRSIKDGKGEKWLFYRCCGWLREYHPVTLIRNLAWVVRPVIKKERSVEETTEKTIGRKADTMDLNDECLFPLEFDVDSGLSHGYWKDLLHILQLAATKKLNCTGDPQKNIYGAKRLAKTQKDKKKFNEKTTRDNLAERLENNPFYRALHLTVARIFSDQLRADLETVNSSHPEVSSISFAAKWAPSLEKMHDRSTLIATTIAEHRFANIPESNFEREIFLRFARERYRRELSVLRKKYPVEIAEENISVKQSQDYPDYKTIDYDNMPDIAMGRYKALFANRDLERFTVFLDKLAEKRAKEAADNSLDLFDKNIKKQKQDTKEEVPKRTGRMVDGYIKSKMLDYEKQLADVNSQWITLVGEVRAHGKLDKCFAAIDFSTKTMCQPKWYDGTVPKDTAIALAMLMAEVNTSDSKKWCVSLDPSHLDYQPANATGTFEEKASRMNANKPETTKVDIKHVFDHLLNFAICNKIKKEDMLKRIFVITGQSLEEAEAKIHGDNKWKACRDKIELAYKEVGYEMPELIYWNLRGRLTPHNAVKKEDGITFITGCSQAMIKVLIETGDIAVKHTHGKYYLVGKDEDILMARQRPDAINAVEKIAKSEDYRMLEIHD